MKKLCVPLLAAGFVFTAASARGAETAPAAPTSAPPATAAAAPKPLAAGQKAPDFTLADVASKNQSLLNFRGKPVAAFFFCGCRACHKVARAWNDIQRSGALAETAPAKGAKAAEPTTMVVFLGNLEETRQFADETQLDAKRTVLLADSTSSATDAYNVDPCPRVFVIDREGTVRYTNDEQGANSYRIPAPLIVARTVEALRRVPAAKEAVKPAAKSPAKPKTLPNGNKAAKKPSHH